MTSASARAPLSPEAAAVARRAVSVFAERGVAAYLVGGAVRDAMMGVRARDLDVAIAASPHEVAPSLADALGGIFVSLDAGRDVARVIVLSGDGSLSHLDVSGFDGRIESDLARRDFTANAMAVELSSALGDDWRAVDPFGGADDLRAGALRVSRDTAFADDPIRLLRAVRLRAETGLRPTESTRALMRRDAALLSQSSPERVREELLKIFAAPGAGRWARMMDEAGILSVLFPELDEARGVEQPKEHCYDVFGHLIAAVDFADQTLRDDFDNPHRGAPNAEIRRDGRPLRRNALGRTFAGDFPEIRGASSRRRQAANQDGGGVRARSLSRTFGGGRGNGGRNRAAAADGRARRPTRPRDGSASS